MAKDEKEICTFQIIFPVDNDEQAIAYKKKIADVLKDKPDAQIRFSLMPAVPRSPMG